MPENVVVQEQEEQEEEEVYGICEWCSDDIITVDDIGADVYSGVICNPCYISEAASCDNCNEVVHYNESYECDQCGNFHCELCNSNHDCPNDSEIPGIFDYGYKPWPVFHGHGPLFMGVELECDEGKKHIDPEQIGDLRPLSDGNKLFYLKEDGSLDNGFEIVTHPASLNFHMKKFPWQNIIDVVKSSGYVSHDTSTCGLHVHVSRLGLGKTENSQELVLSKLVLLFWRFWDQMATFSRRDVSRLDEWSKGNHEYSDGNIIANLNACKGTRDRYVAINVNTDNRVTIEFRLFRGTLKRDTIIATLQMLDVLIQLCQQVGISKIYNMDWAEIVERATVYPELSRYLLSLGLCSPSNSDCGQVGPYYSGAQSNVEVE